MLYALPRANFGSPRTRGITGNLRSRDLQRAPSCDNVFVNVAAVSVAIIVTIICDNEILRKFYYCNPAASRSEVPFLVGELDRMAMRHSFQTELQF